MTNCLLIDDDLDDQEIFAMALQDVDPSIKCIFSENGDQGIDELRNREPGFFTLIFIDLNMPKMNGFETLEHIRSLQKMPLAKIIIYSTTSDKDIIQQATTLGATNFLVKPPSIRELKTALQELLVVNQQENE